MTPELAVLNKVASYYQVNLSESAEAQAYLNERGIHLSTANALQIGWAHESWDALSKVIPGGDLNAALKARVIAKSERGRLYDFFRGRIIFPVRNEEGVIVGFGGRLVSQGEGSSPKYLNSPESELFSKRKILYNLDAVIKEGVNSVVITEGYMDVATAVNVGLNNFVATLGTALTSDHVSLLVDNKIKSVNFAFDGDSAGYQAAVKALEQAAAFITNGTDVKFTFLPSGHDPDDIIKSGGVKSLLTCLDKGIPLYNFACSQFLAPVIQTPSIDIALACALQLKEWAFRSGADLNAISSIIDADERIKPALRVALANGMLDDTSADIERKEQEVATRVF